MNTQHSFPYIFVFLFGLTSCSLHDTKVINQEEVMASVGDRLLYKSELDNVIHPNASVQDSLSLVSAYIDKWVRDQLMAREATRFFSSDFEIERLVDDYREKLLRFKLEERTIETRFDTLISDVELQDFYESIKEQFLVSQDLYRGIYAKFDPNASVFKEFSQKWKAKDTDDSVIPLARAYAMEFHLDTTQWVSLSIIMEWYDGWSKSRADQQLKQRQGDGKYEFFLKIVDHKDKGEISPLEYIRPQLIKMLLHRRKQLIIEEYKQELYEKALNNNNIKLP